MNPRAARNALAKKVGMVRHHGIGAVTGVALLWSALLFTLLHGTLDREHRHTAEMLRQQAYAFYQLILITRSWNSAHGGVFVPLTPDTPEDPYLHAPDRIIRTDHGQMLTTLCLSSLFALTSAALSQSNLIVPYRIGLVLRSEARSGARA